MKYRVIHLVKNGKEFSLVIDDSCDPFQMVSKLAPDCGIVTTKRCTFAEDQVIDKEPSLLNALVDPEILKKKFTKASKELRNERLGNKNKVRRERFR